MKHLLSLTLAVLVAVLCPAQKQTGYVKTPGRLGPKGELIAGQRIAGATLYFTDITSVGSRSDGTFTFAVPGKSFVLTRVQKNGYEPVDRDILGKTRSRSSEPFIVVVDRPDDLLAQRLTNERRLRRTLNDQLRAREDEIEALKEQQRITEDDYHKRLQELYASQENNEKLIADMAERYARMDFDQLDDFRRRVAACIQNGELTRADSLLSTRGTVEERIAQLGRMDEAISRDAADLARRQQAHDKSVALRDRTLQDIGADCYSRYEICLLENKNDSAAYYLELRANTDTLNAEWQLCVGQFINNYICDYEKALRYYTRAHEIYRSKYGENDENVAYCLGNIGGVYDSTGDTSKAAEYYERSLQILLGLFGETSTEVAYAYNNIGHIYISRGLMKEGFEYLTKALKININVLGEYNIDTAINYINIGMWYAEQEDFNKANEFQQKALMSLKPLFGEKHPLVAIIYNNLGGFFSEQKDLTTAIEYYQKSLKISSELCGDKHKDIATTYNNIAGIYITKKEYDTALEYYQKALKIRLDLFGDKHPAIASSYSNLGVVYSYKEDYEKALEYNQKSLHIRLNLYGENHPDLSTNYNNLAVLYVKRHNPLKATEYFRKAMDIKIQFFGETHPAVERIYAKLAKMYALAQREPEKLPLSAFDRFTPEQRQHIIELAAQTQADK